MSYKDPKEIEVDELGKAATYLRKMVDRIVNEFKNESERHLVILGAAKLEDLLLNLLERRLLESPTKNDGIFRGTGALSTFSARSEMAYRLGLISKPFLDALNSIRKVRNEFAHQFDASLLDGGNEERIIQLVSEIKETEAFQSLIKGYFGGESTTRTQLCVMLTLLILRLEGAVLRVERIHPSSPLEVIPDDWKAAKEIGAAVQEVVRRAETE
ncbi:hypothetical protein WCQ02_35025 [Paraburkholderia tropica]|uniref:hypothetical protein n=1 Tax=Paraburkholderia tropica TaxID=92647 RepID=UPI000D75100A|nr:hypothetical protein [Paraburkholderia tropica]